LANAFLFDYQVNEKKFLWRAQLSAGHLKRYFKRYRVTEITTDRIRDFIESRIAEGAANATINRELAALKKMMNLGAKQNPPRVDRVPYIPMLKENKTRKGFFEHGEFIALRDALPSYLKPFVTFAYKTGWRFAEAAGLPWSQVDRKQGIVRLELGRTKNDSGRTIYLDDELKEIFNKQWELRKKSKVLSPYVFPNRHGSGKISDIRFSWKAACVKAKIGKKLFHDLRRTAVRNMVRSGIPERIAMIISGHKTRSVFERYNIVDDKDLKQAAARLDNHLESQSRKPSGRQGHHEIPRGNGRGCQDRRKYDYSDRRKAQGD